MSALPPALRPWASQLSLFQEDLALHLGAYVARLSAALGSLRSRGESEGGEPQGYDGLTRRGSHDRLLVSEWLWALEFPDEFVRRAAFGELSFLKPVFRQPQGARRTVALLDAGPDQLGAPRIAHLALLIVLSRRAEAAGAAFCWGILQSDPEKGAFSAVTPHTVGAWLAARDPTPPTDARLAAWRDALSLDAAPEDAWLVGDSRLSRLPTASGLSRVDVAEVLVPGARQLTVEVRPSSRVARSVVLDLPPPDTCVRLLRDPLQQARATRSVAVPPVGTPPLRAFCFSADGHRLLLYREDCSVAAMALPRSGHGSVPKNRQVTPSPGAGVLGVGWRRNGGILVLTEAPTGRYVLYGHLRSNRTRKNVRHAFPMEDKDVRPTLAPGGLPPGRLLPFDDGHGNERLLLAGMNMSLFLVEKLPQGDIVISRVARGITAAALVTHRVVFVSNSMLAQEGQLASGTCLGILRGDNVDCLPLGTEGDAAYFGYSGAAAHPDAGLLAVRHAPDLWRLFLAGGTVDVPIPSGLRVVGTGTWHEAPGEPGMLALDEDRRTFWLLAAKGRYKVAVASEDVLYAEASHAVPVLGWLLKGGGLVLCDLKQGGILYQALPGAGG